MLFDYVAPQFTGTNNSSIYIGPNIRENISYNVFSGSLDYLEEGGISEIHTVTPSSYLNKAMYFKCGDLDGGGGSAKLKINYYVIDFN